MNSYYTLPNGRRVNWEGYKKYMAQQMEEMDKKAAKTRKRTGIEKIFPAFNSDGW